MQFKIELPSSHSQSLLKLIFQTRLMHAERLPTNDRLHLVRLLLEAVKANTDVLKRQYTGFIQQYGKKDETYGDAHLFQYDRSLYTLHKAALDTVSVLLSPESETYSALTRVSADYTFVTTQSLPIQNALHSLFSELIQAPPTSVYIDFSSVSSTSGTLLIIQTSDFDLLVDAFSSSTILSNASLITNYSTLDFSLLVSPVIFIQEIQRYLDQHPQYSKHYQLKHNGFLWNDAQK